MVRTITGAWRATSGECSSTDSGVIAPMVSSPDGAATILREAVAQFAQGDQPARPEHAGLHHQHQRGAAGDRPHVGVVGIDRRDRLFQRGGLDQLERRHGAAPLAKAAASFSLKCFSISFALALSTG